MSPFYALNVETEERKLASKHHSELHGFGPHGLLDTAMGRGLGVGDRDMDGSTDSSNDSSSSKSGKGGKGKGKPKLSSRKTGKGGKGKGGNFEYKTLSSSGSSKSGKGKGGSSGSSKSGKGKGGSKGSKKSGRGGALQNLNFVMVSCVPLSSNILLLLVDTMSNSSYSLDSIHKQESTSVTSLVNPADFTLTTVLTLKGDIFNYVDTAGASVKGDDNMGDFRGICTITGAEQYLCTYELYFQTDGEVQAGGLNIRGPVSGSLSVAVVTGTSFDYSIYDTGSVTLEQDPDNSWLIAKTELYLQNY
jgi:hypothetical protein